MERAYKFRIYPNKTQEKLIIKTFGCARFVYNHFLNRRNELYKVDKATLKYTQCSKELTILKQKKEWLQEPDKCALQNSLKDLDNAYKNFFTQAKAGFPKFKSKHDSTNLIVQAVISSFLAIRYSSQRLEKSG